MRAHLVHCACGECVNRVCCADTLLENLTVSEMLMYTAEMKNPQSQPLSEKRAKVDMILDQLALLSCRNVRIGSALARGVSGVQSCCMHLNMHMLSYLAGESMMLSTD